MKTPEQELKMIAKAVIKSIIKEQNDHLIPIIKRNKSQYRDGWSDDIKSFFDSMRDFYQSKSFYKILTKKIQRPLSRAEAQTTSRFIKGVNRSVGIDYTKMLKSQGLEDLMQSSLDETVSLITGMASDHIKAVQSIVTNGMASGITPSSIASDISERTGVSTRKAKRIARDQVSRTNGAVDRARAQQAGLKKYRWSTSKDGLVSGKPSGKYPNAKIKCWKIAERDVGYGKGIYTYRDGAEWAGEKNLHPSTAHIGCRCRAIAMIEGVNYFPNKEK